MIARLWRCRCPLRHHQGFIEHLRATGVQETSATPGFLGEQILTRELDGGTVEISLVSYWESMDAVRAFAGDDPQVARLYPGDEAYEIDPDRHVTHYSVVEHHFSKE